MLWFTEVVSSWPNFVCYAVQILLMRLQLVLMISPVGLQMADSSQHSVAAGAGVPLLACVPVPDCMHSSAPSHMDRRYTSSSLAGLLDQLV